MGVLFHGIVVLLDALFAVVATTIIFFGAWLLFESLYL